MALLWYFVMDSQEPSERPPSLWQTASSVLASFFGVQSRKNRERDFTHGKPLHFILMGVLATAGFIAVVMLAVKLALIQAGV